MEDMDDLKYLMTDQKEMNKYERAVILDTVESLLAEYKKILVPREYEILTTRYGIVDKSYNTLSYREIAE